MEVARTTKPCTSSGLAKTSARARSVHVVEARWSPSSAAFGRWDARLGRRSGRLVPPLGPPLALLSRQSGPIQAIGVLTALPGPILGLLVDLLLDLLLLPDVPGLVTKRHRTLVIESPLTRLRIRFPHFPHSPEDLVFLLLHKLDPHLNLLARLKVHEPLRDVVKFQHAYCNGLVVRRGNPKSGPVVEGLFDGALEPRAGVESAECLQRVGLDRRPPQTFA
mmetsp:Transcript_126127/g.403632  ORF Transcript_126127/g.403632 Transcript_126127/m.403632 type:complete len:221 (-) Transcript_126127:864-1526(-)